MKMFDKLKNIFRKEKFPTDKDGFIDIEKWIESKKFGKEEKDEK